MLVTNQNYSPIRWLISGHRPPPLIFYSPRFSNPNIFRCSKSSDGEWIQHKVIRKMKMGVGRGLPCWRCYIKPLSSWLKYVRHSIAPFSQMESYQRYKRVQQNEKQITASQTNMIQRYSNSIVEIESVLQYVTQSCHGEMNSRISGVPAI